MGHDVVRRRLEEGTRDDDAADAAGLFRMNGRWGWEGSSCHDDARPCVRKRIVGGISKTLAGWKRK